ncbi:hypothetical protein EHS25_003906 [Saitozyma podzolica]|uniref:FAD-binding domain-containing protein n=1 Tax=Saitozyma podzolica TaxID=1890683 RepID=A0A427Y3W0_9TREE|nr:hypothetical protein EHS25_003906 [Saitozyma podzolica]
MASPQHVLIIGGGLGGPALAIALARRNIRSSIYELRSEPGDIGGALMLPPNALRVLDKVVGVYESVRSSGYVLQRVTAYASDGMKLGEVGLGEEKEDGYPAVRIRRPTLHKVLLEECARHGVTIQYGKKLERIEETDDGVTAFLVDGTSATGDILVGADGIHSKVREHVLGPAAPTATYSGLCGIGGTLPQSQIRTPPGYHFPAFIYTSAGMLMAMLVDPEGQTIGWASQETIPDKGREGWEEYQRTGQAARAAKKTYQAVTHEPIRSIMDGIVDDQVNLWAPYELPDLPTWHTNRGSAQAFEDAGYLARLLESHDAVAKGYDKVFARFEKVRKDRFQHVRDITAASGSTRRGSGPGLAWTFRKWATKAYFWFKGGVLRDTRITGYDVQEEDIGVES